MKLACLSFTDKGFELGEKISKIQSNKYRIEHYVNINLDEGIKGFLKSEWMNFDGFIFISATGIAIRMINDYIKSKDKDPAIIVIDDMGKFSISLLSGHLGGANEIAQYIGESIGATPVITTASDNRGIESIDIFAKKNNYYIKDIQSLTKVISLMVNEKKIGFYTENSEIIKYNNLKILKELKEIDNNLDGLILITSKDKIPEINIPYALLRPRNINIGIGCRKDTETEIIIEAIELALKEQNLSNNSIKAMGTVEIKKYEKGLIEAAKYYNCPLKIFKIDEIEPIEDMFIKSEFVKDTIGVYSVSEPCAYLLGGKVITRKTKFKGVTISISI